MIGSFVAQTFKQWITPQSAPAYNAPIGLAISAEFLVRTAIIFHERYPVLFFFGGILRGANFEPSVISAFLEIEATCRLHPPT